VAKLLRRWGFSPQKPVFSAYEQSPVQVRRWLTEQYPAIRRRAARQGAVVFWLDEVGLRSQHQSGTSYAPKGKTPVLKKTGQRFSVNMISAISNRGCMVFMVVEKNFNTAVFLAFLCKLVKVVDKKVFLIADTHPVHQSKMVERWLREHTCQIELFFLPLYSPELNPDELFNQDLKTNGVGKARPRNQQELKARAQTFAKKKKRNPQKIKKYFHHKIVKYAL
jgi:transposase